MWGAMFKTKSKTIAKLKETFQVICRGNLPQGSIDKIVINFSN